jgi:hypothetical protein
MVLNQVQSSRSLRPTEQIAGRGKSWRCGQRLRYNGTSAPALEELRSVRSYGPGSCAPIAQLRSDWELEFI